jgi:predicted chitinase
MNRETFFASLRRRDSGVFGTSLSQPQVIGTEALLDSCVRNGVTNAHHVANILAQCYHETGGRMSPVREAFASSDQQAINALDRAWAAGRLKWVKTPYWRPDADGKSWFGRGFVQITHKANYAKMGERLRVNLTGNPSLALDPKISADIAVVGMSEGMFTGRKLSDYNFPAALNAHVSQNPRRIVNGQDGTDARIAGYHRAFHAALIEAGWTGKASQAPIKPDPRPQASKHMPVPEARPEPTQGGKTGILPFVVAGLLAGGAAALHFLGFI